MEVTEQVKTKNFINLLIQRGLGIYGHDKMSSICYDAGVLLLDDDSVQFGTDSIDVIRNKFLVNYAKFNLIAKMTVMALAKQYNMEVPDEIKKSKRKKSRFRKIFKRE